MNAADREVIRKALDHLSATCTYHGESIERLIGFGGRPVACCDTGRPALARRAAVAALDAEEAARRADA